MKIIDFERKGNVVRFYLGEYTEDWGWTRSDYQCNGETPNWLKPSESFYGDDWNDYPYDCNAGRVYGEFLRGYTDMTFGFDDLVLEPCEAYGRVNCEWSKDDMADRRVPCIIVVPAQLIKETKSWYLDDFNHWVADPRVVKYFFGDEMSPDVEVGPGECE